MYKRTINKIISFVLVITMLCSIIGITKVGASAPSKVGEISVVVKQLKSGELDYSSSQVAKVTKVKKAYKVLHIFNGLGYVSCDYNKQIKKNGMYYYKVTAKKLNTMKKLKKYLKKYFSNSYIKKLLKKKQFISKKGHLYFSGGERGSDISYQYTKYQIIKKTSAYRTIKATSYYWNEDFPEEGKETKVDTYKQRKINGRWVFTSITLPY